MLTLSAGGNGLVPFYALGFELGPWQEYLARELTPDYLADPELPPLYISWMAPESVTILPAFAEDLMRGTQTWTTFQYDWQHLDTLNQQGTLQGSMILGPGVGSGFERQMLTPGIFRELDDGSLLGVEAVLAYQSYGTSLLGQSTFGMAHEPALAGLRNENSWSSNSSTDSGYGTGVRLNLHRALTEGLAFNMGFQSRIDMEEFANFRGVYSSPADFDLPARANLGLSLQARERSWFSLNIERVMYSEVAAFPSAMLPDRFLSLLGDSTSPEFAWQDLTVYTLGWAWSGVNGTRWNVDLSTRTTPSASSPILQRALESELAEHAMLVGYSKPVSDRSRFNLNAAYAPAEYVFGGNVLGVASESLDQAVELEASWTVEF